LPEPKEYADVASGIQNQSPEVGMSYLICQGISYLGSQHRSAGLLEAVPCCGQECSLKASWSYHCAAVDSSLLS